MKIPIINDSLEKFDTENFSGKIRKNKKSSGTSENIHQNNTQNLFEVRDDEGNLLLFYSKSDDSQSSFSGYDYSLNPIIGVYREFYPNNNLKTKGIYCWFGFKIGKWYSYTPDGILDSMVDYDLGYSYNYEQIFQYCKDNKISLEKKIDGYKTTISKYKSPTDGQVFWGIRYVDIQNQVFINIKILGIDGSLVEQKESPLPGFEEAPNKQ